MNNWELLAKYISEECTVAEKAEVNAWLKENPDQEAFLDRARQTWQMAALDVGSFQPDITKAKTAIAKRIGNAQSDSAISISHSSTKANQILLFRKVAAVLLVGVFISYLVYYFSASFTPEVKYMTAITGKGQKQKVILADGSKIWLNENASFKYPETFEEKTRSVYLEGEAFFEVARDEQIPFFIHAGNSVTQVLGTSFSVSSKENGGVVVEVVEGKVLFFEESNEDKGVVLIKGEQAILKPEASSIKKSKTNDPNRLTWHTGVLQFKNMHLEEVAKLLSRFYNIAIEIEGNEIKKCHYNATFDNQSLDDVLDVIKLSFPELEIEKTDKKITLKGKKCA